MNLVAYAQGALIGTVWAGVAVGLACLLALVTGM